MSCKRSGAGVGVMDGVLYAVGGHDGPTVRNTVETFNPAIGHWKTIADMSLCRRNAGEFCVIRNRSHINIHYLILFVLIHFQQVLFRIMDFYTLLAVMMVQRICLP